MLQRTAITFLEASFSLFPVVLITGARQVGKSMTLEKLKEKGVLKNIVVLDDISVLNSAKEDPIAFIESLETPVAIDEIQRCPELMLAIKAKIDREKKDGFDLNAKNNYKLSKGKFVLTGSANVMAHPEIRESLAGRIDIIQLEGLSAREIKQKKSFPLFSDFMNLLKQKAELAEMISFLSLYLPESFVEDELETNIYYGAYPEVRLSESDFFRNRWFASYEITYIERDIRNFRVDDVFGFNKLFRYIAQRSGSLVNYHQVATAIGLDQRTVKRYIELLELTYQATQLQAYHSNYGKRMIKTPKIYLNDTGHMSFTQGVELTKLKENDNYGCLLENWLFSELRKLAYMETNQTRLYFYRSHAGKEVDFIAEKGNQILAIECKGKRTISKKEISGLEVFLSDYPEAFGIIFYTGKDILTYGSRILAIPMRIFF